MANDFISPIENSLTDEGNTILKKDSAAIIWSKSEGFVLSIPNEFKDGKVPDDIIILTACFIKLSQSKEFRDELLHWFQNKSN